MTFLLILMILIGFSLWGAHEYYQVKLGVTPKSTSPVVAAALSEIMLELGENGNFLDLGSGYGGLVLSLAKRMPDWQIFGVELSPTPWVISQMRSVGKNFVNYRFFLGDARTWNFRNCDVIFVHQNQKIIREWETGLARRLQPGTLLITLNHPLPRIQTSNNVAIDDQNTLYIYRKAEPQIEPVVEAAVNDLPPAQPGPELKVQSEGQMDLGLNPPQEPSQGDSETGD